jgi:hypothetical protein
MRFLFSTLFACSIIASGAAAATPITYDVGTVAMRGALHGVLSDYVVTGTITTNGTLGPLRSADFISWSLKVDGPLPYHFHSGNPGARIGGGSVSATEDFLLVQGQFGRFSVDASEDTVPNCLDCSQNLFWRAWTMGGVAYLHYRDGHEVLIAQGRKPNSGPLVLTIGTRIPEPFGFTTALVGASILSGLIRFRRDFRGRIPSVSRHAANLCLQH